MAAPRIVALLAPTAAGAALMAVVVIAWRGPVTRARSQVGPRIVPALEE